MYDSSWDLSLLRNNYEIEIKSILDLRPAVALLNYDKKDLHSIINLELGLSLEKKDKYQRYNWTRRPIKQQALQYAINDVWERHIRKNPEYLSSSWYYDVHRIHN